MRSIERRALRQRLILAATTAALCGCSESTGVSSIEPALRGTVARVGRTGAMHSVIVDRLEVPTNGYDHGVELFVRWPDRTARVYVEGTDGALRLGSVADLGVGARVLAWSTGVERRSLPPQWDATRVVVLAAPR